MKLIRRRLWPDAFRPNIEDDDGDPLLAPDDILDELEPSRPRTSSSALIEVLNVLAPFSAADRTRVIRAVATFYEVTLP